MQILLATNNQHKVSEIRAMLPDRFTLLTLADIGWNEPIEEPFHTFSGNAAAKASVIQAHCGLPVLADDSGLVVEALDGRPGVLSARYAGEPADDAANRNKVLGELEDIRNRQAHFVAVLAYCTGPGRMHFFTGQVEGRIVRESRGTGGFGYDPIFIPQGFDKTFAELPQSLKNRISHRGRALRSFVDFVQRA